MGCLLIATGEARRQPDRSSGLPKESSMRRILFAIVLSLLAILAAPVGNGYGASLLNGDFSLAGTPPDPFANWTTSFGDAPTNGGGFAVFAESGNSSLIQLEQAFTLPNGARTLSFEFSLTSVAGGTSGGPPDSFQATLYDKNFNPFPTSTAPPFPAFFSQDNTGQQFFKSNFVSITALSGGRQRVTLDLSTLSPECRHRIHPQRESRRPNLHRLA